ncbi:hypothetical protein J2127_000798 [Methanococcus voltae]|uniref:hypothetical protein n=1 Tax=Methanococcus voltae TaxID=2188 RepID=UPI001AE1EFDF|nr:hypothetical protein [Methanococcus voltae]MBP2143643.1 hypothetical protein [Methanococcus voltae]
MAVMGAQGKKLDITYGDNVILKLINEEGELLDNAIMDDETATLFITLLNQGVVLSEEINRKYKKDGIRLHKIQDVGTCFADDCRVSIAILPADEKRTASILIGIHKENTHNALIVKPKRASFISFTVLKMLMENATMELE